MTAPSAQGAVGAATADGSGLSLWVRMKGLPARVTSGDIEAFFTGLRLASQSPILFKRHADGRTTGAVRPARVVRGNSWGNVWMPASRQRSAQACWAVGGRAGLPPFDVQHHCRRRKHCNL